MPLALQAPPDCKLNPQLAFQFASSRRLVTNPTTSLSIRSNLPKSLISSRGPSLFKAHKHEAGSREELALSHWQESRQETADLKVLSAESRQGNANRLGGDPRERYAKLLGAAVLAGALVCSHSLPALADTAGALSDTVSGLAEATPVSDFKSGFSSSFLLIFFSEIGDKTFFIAALLATRKSNLAVFSGTFGALAAMTVISVTLGRAFHYLDDLIPATQFPLDDLAAVVLLVYFGVSTLIDAASMEGSKAEEEKQDAELAIAGFNGQSAAASTVAATFALVFVAEWGDKSFFSTIALAAASSPAGVVTGAIAGHAVATVLAVLGGSILSEYISEKLIAYVGGSLFLVFAATTLVGILR